jgi:hypothetical protein
MPALDIQTADAVKQWLELKQRYATLRGVKEGKNRKQIPKTTHSDVLQLCTAWSRELRKVEPRSDHERSEHGRWMNCTERVATIYDSANPSAEYPENEAFWQECTSRLAVYLESRKVVPSKWQLFLDAVVEAVAELPETIGHAGREVASGAARLIQEPAKLAALLLGAAILLPPVIRAFRK